jgi:sulfite reductase alpha subunit-like flavoprotein
VSEHIARQARRRNLSITVQSFDSFDRRKLPEESTVIFVACTAGEGDVPDNMKKFWNFMLRKDLPASSLDGLEYAVFGLGDSSYTKFNAVARKLNTRLKQLGAKELLPRALGDDQSENGYLTDLDPWLETLWQKLLEKFPLPNGFVVDDAPQMWRPKFDVKWLENRGQCTSANTSDMHMVEPSDTSVDAAVVVGDDDRVPHSTPAEYFSARVLVNHRMTAPEW